MDSKTIQKLNNLEALKHHMKKLGFKYFEAKQTILDFYEAEGNYGKDW